jgi:hypothetical protein
MSETNGKTELRLSELTIRFNTYGEHRDKYTGQIKYEGRYGSTEVILDPVISERVLLFIGPVITQAATKVAKEIELNIVRSIDALNNQQAIEAGDLLNAGVAQTDPPTEVKAQEEEEF